MITSRQKIKTMKEELVMCAWLCISLPFLTVMIFAQIIMLPFRLRK